MDCSFIGVASKQSSQRALWGRGPRVGGEKEEVHLRSPQADNELIQLLCLAQRWKTEARKDDQTHTELNSEGELKRDSGRDGVIIFTFYRDENIHLFCVNVNVNTMTHSKERNWNQVSGREQICEKVYVKSEGKERKKTY